MYENGVCAEPDILSRPQCCKKCSSIVHTLESPFLCINSLRPKLNRRPFADDIFKCIFLNENEWILPRISLKFVPKVRINKITALVQIMAWRRPGDKPLSEPMMVSLLTHICVTRPQWVKPLMHISGTFNVVKLCLLFLSMAEQGNIFSNWPKPCSTINRILGPFYRHYLNSIRAWKSNYINYKVLDEIIIPHFTGHAITYPCRD